MGDVINITSSPSTLNYVQKMCKQQRRLFQQGIDQYGLKTAMYYYEEALLDDSGYCDLQKALSIYTLNIFFFGNKSVTKVNKECN